MERNLPNLPCLAILCSLGCGAAEDNALELVDLGEDSVPDYSQSRGVFPYGQVPPPEDGTVDKSFTATDNGEFFPRFVAVKSPYGMRGTARCQANPAIWNQNCEVSQSRNDKVYFDIGSCTSQGVHSNLTNKLLDGYFYLEATLQDEVGWNITRTLTPANATITVKCDTSIGVGGQGRKAVDFCWNLPGFPHDVCFTKLGGGFVNMGLVAIQAAKGTGTAGQIFVFNVVRHEILHTLSFGHFAEEGNLMNTGQPDSFITELSATQIDAMRNFLMSGSSSGPRYCNWQPGDPLGNFCPNRVAP